MHILVTNDDGPPSAESSPYILPFVRHLEAAGHLVSVVIPNTQRSWIAKAHIVGQDVRAAPFQPGPLTGFPSLSSDDDDTNNKSASGTSSRPWYTVNSTPASCAVVGLHHLFPSSSSSSSSSSGGQEPRVDLVVSGPNYGRNTTSCFALSSGTLGAALEAAVSGHRAIALSFAFTGRENRVQDVAAACRLSVRVVEHLAAHGAWHVPPTTLCAGASDEVERRGNPGGVVFSVNVPVREDVEGREVRWTEMLQNSWASSCFTEHEPEKEGAGRSEEPEETEREIRAGEADGKDREEVDEGAASAGPGAKNGERHFKWSPKFTDVYASVERAGEGSDGWAVAQGHTSVTMLRANFMHVPGTKGLLKL